MYCLWDDVLEISVNKDKVAFIPISVQRLPIMLNQLHLSTGLVSFEFYVLQHSLTEAESQALKLTEILSVVVSCSTRRIPRRQEKT